MAVPIGAEKSKPVWYRDQIPTCPNRAEMRYEARGRQAFPFPWIAPASSSGSPDASTVGSCAASRLACARASAAWSFSDLSRASADVVLAAIA